MDKKVFQKKVWNYYQNNARKDLPWRRTSDPYCILVSEVMLQQTQVDRVIPKYQNFLKQFPTVRALAHAPLSVVLKEWQGLGYNRRAKMLHMAAKEIVQNHANVFPSTLTELQKLPGIGSYTASAVMAFAHNVPVTMIETNIRTVYLHSFFKDANDVTDSEMLQLVAKTLDHERPREWYFALMDYGTYLKKEYGNPNSRSKHYTKQSKFTGSNRQIRGAVIRTLAAHSHLTRKKLHKVLSSFEEYRVDAQVERLIEEGMITRKGSRLFLPR